MTVVHMSYMGSLTMFGSQFLCTNMTASKEQTPRFYDHIVGLKDQNFSTTVDGISQKGPYFPLTGGGGGYDQVQKRFWRYPPALYKGSAAGPFVEDSVGLLMEYAIKCNPFDAEMIFWNDGVRQTIYQALISNLSISMRAGDITSFSLEMVSKDMVSDTSTPTEADCSKLLTWDMCQVAFSGVGAGTYHLSEFSLSISNPIMPIFTAKPIGVPKELRVGMQEVTGTVSSYEAGVAGDSITFAMGSNEYTIGVVFAGPSDAGTTGPFINTVSFTGTNDGPVWS